MTELPTEKDGVPVLAGFIERRTKNVAGPPAMLLRVWCRWCCRWHEHGLGGSAVGDYTHRVAHCYAPDSPYDKAGYWILVSAASFASRRKGMRAATVYQRSAIRSGRISEAVQRLRDQPTPTH